MLEFIQKPQDIKELNYEDVAALGEEIRNFMIECVSNNGGHLASNLGVVELTMALHRVFDSPRDQLIFDVGHQCYTHKILTGRYKNFYGLRKENGLSGFPNPLESEHDILKTGHSSTSISSAIGLLKAFQLQGEEDRCVVAVIGDGAMTGGLAYEGLNNGGRISGNLIVILNDNEMSISRNVGSFAENLAHIRSRQGYFKFKDFLTRTTNATPLVGKWLYKAFQKIKQALKAIFYQGNIFEDMGFAYLGPIDGHNLAVLERVLRRAKDLKRPCLVHVRTIKGKGYPFAESKPLDFHGLGAFDIETGEGSKKAKEDYSAVLGKLLCDAAEQNDKICAVTAAMTVGCGLTAFSTQFPERFFDVGIAEQHAITFSAGLARNGMLPVFAVYSSFLQRGYDQIIHDAALQGLKMIFCIDRAGIVGEDGETHQGLFDIPMLLPVPGITIYSPATYKDLTNAFNRAIKDDQGIVAIRYPRGYSAESMLSLQTADSFAEWFDASSDICVVSYGREFFSCYDAIQSIKPGVALLKLNRIFPIEQEIIDHLSRYKAVILFEECYECGGIGSYIGNQLMHRAYKGIYRSYGIKNDFIKAGKASDLLKEYGLDSNGVSKAILAVYEEIL